MCHRKRLLRRFQPNFTCTSIEGPLCAAGRAPKDVKPILFWKLMFYRVDWCADIICELCDLSRFLQLKMATPFLKRVSRCFHERPVYSLTCTLMLAMYILFWKLSSFCVDSAYNLPPYAFRRRFFDFQIFEKKTCVYTRFFSSDSERTFLINTSFILWYLHTDPQPIVTLHCQVWAECPQSAHRKRPPTHFTVLILQVKDLHSLRTLFWPDLKPGRKGGRKPKKLIN
jgi:hypothetical protein